MAEGSRHRISRRFVTDFCICCVRLNRRSSEDNFTPAINSAWPDYFLGRHSEDLGKSTLCRNCRCSIRSQAIVQPRFLPRRGLHIPRLFRLGPRQCLVRRFTVFRFTLSACAMAASVSPLSNKMCTRDSKPLPKPVAFLPKFFSASAFRNSAACRRGVRCANSKNRLLRASLLAFILRSRFHPEWT